MAHDGRRPHRRSTADCLQRRVEQLGHLVSEHLGQRHGGRPGQFGGVDRYSGAGRHRRPGDLPRLPRRQRPRANPPSSWCPGITTPRTSGTSPMCCPWSVRRSAHRSRRLWLPPTGCVPTTGRAPCAISRACPLTDRSTPVTQPRTVGDIVEELHTVLAAAAVPGPYLLVGHSLGGLIVRLYGQTYPDQIDGIVFVDALQPDRSVSVRTRPVGDLPGSTAQPAAGSAPLEALRGPDSEPVDLDASVAQALAAPALPVMPLVVLTKTESFGGLTSLPGPTGGGDQRPLRAGAGRFHRAGARTRRRSSRPEATTTFSSPSPIWWSPRPNW